MKVKLEKRELIFKILFSLFYLVLIFTFYRFGIGCIFKTFFGLPCPGCGMTRAVLSLLHFDIAGALKYHPMVFSLPILYVYFLTNGNLFGKKTDKIIIGIILSGFALNWIFNLVNCIG